ncbi:MAG TPA: hypothetical protein VJX67_17800 [Blastocatellia bacterium]|nr:hypothetical protein [Blastocatellia bacterium]
MMERLLALVVTAATVLVAATGFSNVVSHAQDHGSQGRLRDEVNQSYQLSPGANVQVSGINGPVEIETTGGTTAHVQVIRTADSEEALTHHRVSITGSASSLTVRGEEDHSRARVRQHVILRIPAAANVTVGGVNGRVKVGQINGSVNVQGVNGQVDVGQASSSSDISGINGNISMTLTRVSQAGLHVSGINGGIELRFPESLNADLEVSNINGTVFTDLPNVTIQGKWGPRNFHARIGEGGAAISITSVNGRVHISRS